MRFRLHSLRSACLALQVVLFLPLTAVAQPAYAGSAFPYEEFLLTMSYRGEPLGELLPALLPSSTSESIATRQPLLLASGLLEGLGFLFETEATGAIKGTRQPDDAPFAFYTDGRYEIGGKEGRLQVEDFSVINHEIYLSPRAVALALPVRLIVEAPTQRLVIQATAPLPQDLARARELAHAQFVAKEIGAPAPLTPFPYRRYGRPMGDVRSILQHNSDDRTTQLSYDGLLVSEVGYSTALLFFRGSDQEALSDARLRVGRESPLGSVYRMPGLTSAFAGDVTASSASLVGTSSGRGIALSAYPLDRPDSFERTTIDGNAPPGWDVELFRGNELLAFSQVGSDGRYEFQDVPLLFGDNALRVVLHGPDGQMRESTREFRVGAGMAQPGMAYWRVFAGERNTRLLDGLLAETEGQYPAGSVYTAEADVGITRWLTANVFAARSAENNRIDSPLQESYGGGVRLSLPVAYLELDAGLQDSNSMFPSGGTAWSLSGLTSLGTISISARHEEYEDFLGQRATRGDTPLVSYTLARATTSLPLRRIPLGISLAGERWRLINGNEETSLYAQARFSVSGIYLTQEIEQRQFDNKETSARDRTLYWTPTASVNLGPRFRASLSGRYNMDQPKWETVIVSGNFRIDDRTVTTFGINRDEDVEGVETHSASLAISRDFGSFWGNATFSHEPDGQYLVGVGLNFSLGFGRHGGPRLSSRSLAQLGMADVQVFHDRNGDDRYDPADDELLPGARIRVNGSSQASSGAEDPEWQRVDGLDVARPVMLDIDPTSIPDPFLTAVEGGVRFLPRPGVSFEVSLPLVDTGTVGGVLLLEREGSSMPMSSVVMDLLRLGEGRTDGSAAVGAGLSVGRLVGRESRGTGADELANRVAHRVVRSVRSQHDGSFLFDLVPPGKYLVRVRPGQVLRGVPLGSAEAAVEVERDSLTVEGLELSLAPLDEVRASNRVTAESLN